MGKLFDALKRVVVPFLPKMQPQWAEPLCEDGPAVFICNHMGAMGPIYMVTTFPLAENSLAWCNDGVLEEERIVEYARHDFWWRPDSVFAPLWNVTIPYIAKAVVPKVMRSAPVIPVHHDHRILSTMRQSVKALREGKHIVIFPEKPDGFDSHDEYLQMGWLNLCVLYRKATGRDLPVYPVHIDPKGHAYHIGKPITVDAGKPLDEQESAIERYLAAGLRGKNAP